VSADDPGTHEDLLASLLAAGDEALAGGQSGDRLCPPGTPDELRSELERDLSYVRAVRRLLGSPTPTDAEPPGPPGAWTTLGRFELGPELGRGGCGLVFLAHDPLLGRAVAIKVPRAEVLAAPAWRARFQREARAAAALDHPNIVPVYEAGEAGPVCFLVSAYCPGVTLAAWLQQHRGPVPARAAAWLVAALADGVQHAHGRGVIHRDLKPGNVLLEPLPPGQATPPDGLDFTPRLTDFGLAKLLQEGADAGQTQSGAVLGTVGYMAPEQAAGQSRDVGPAADVYALGAILYEVVTGRPPFQGESELDTVRQVRHEEPVPPRRLRPAVPRDLETVCLKCLEKEPARRYATAGALAEDLRRFLAGEPVRARPPGPAGRLGRWARRNPALAASGALAAAALAAVVVLAVGFALHQSRAAGAVREQERKTRAALTEAERQHVRAERQVARLADDRGLVLCEQGQVGPGMLWLVQGLETAAKLSPADGADLERVARANLAAWRRELRPVRAILPHDNRGVKLLVFSPDGRTIGTVGWDSTARVWDAATGHPLGPPFVSPHDPDDYAFAFSPDCRTLLTQDRRDWTARLWDVATGKLLGAPLEHQSQIGCAAFSPDGKTVLTGSQDGTGRFWEVASGKPTGPLLRHEGAVFTAAFSPDGRAVLTGAGNGTARLWEAATGKVLCSLPHPGYVWSVAFSPDGRTLLTGCQDSLARFWDAATGQEIGPPLPHGGAVYGAVFAEGGRTVWTASSDGVARAWSLADRRPLGLPLSHRNPVKAVAVRPDGGALLTAGWAEPARLWEVAPARPPVVTLAHPGQVRAVAFSPDGRTLLTGGTDNVVRYWDTATGAVDGPTLRHEGRVLAVRFSPDGRTVLTGSHDGTGRLWDAGTGRPIGRPLVHRKQVNAVAFSPDGRIALTGSDDRTVRFWDAATGEPLDRPPLRHPGEVQEVACSGDGRTVVTSAADSGVYFWDAVTGEPLGEQLRQEGRCMGLALSPDGRAVLTGGLKTAQLWDVATRQPLGPPLGHQGTVREVAFSPDGRTLVTAGGDSTVRLWDAASGNPIGPPLVHDDEVTAVALRPDGRVLLTGSIDRTARLWPLPEPCAGEPERIRLWVQVLTAMELDEGGMVHVLDAPAWQERRRRLDQLGGPPQ
jgi:WD40 repeat protein